MKYKVSVIVPIYNGEKTIGNCLDNLLKQTLKEMEIVCVNDGSSDATDDILKEYAKKNSNIKIVRQKNGGLSAARNTGIKNATAPYVMFCDDDDIFATSMCSEMVKAIEEEGVDIVACGTKVEYEVHSEITTADRRYYRIKFDGKQYINENIISKTDVSVCDKLFRRDLLMKYNIRFPDGLNNEDYYFYNAYMCKAKTIFFIKKKYYKYIRREGSIMSGNFEKNSFSPDHLLVVEKLFSFYKKNNFLKGHIDFFWKQFIESYHFSYLHSAEERRKEIQKMAGDFAKKHYNDYQPTDLDVKRKIKEIMHYGLIYRIFRLVRQKVTRIYSRVNIAYRQQEFINARIIDTDQEIRDLIDYLEDIREERYDRK